MKKQHLAASIVLMGAMFIPFLASADAVTDTISNITNWIITISAGLAVLMYVIAGFLWMSDGGSAERAKMAKSIIGSTTIGLIVILLAAAIASVVSGFVNPIEK
ncbi:MAG TPA: pilin [Candidatus Pacearchaeota archaeon]|nr:pilin [Candidatus Pacearchaeota archaeon]HPR79713.1 pilin [Candidatus Pacearchaeota archaeon]